MITKETRIFLAGHGGLVGSSIFRWLDRKGYTNIVIKEKKELDLTIQGDVHAFFNNNSIECVILAAAKVGGILANSTYPYNFIYDNLSIQNNIISSSMNSGVKYLLMLGSSCIYPKHCDQPMKEEYLLTGPLESTNESYAIAKIAGIKMCEAARKQYNFDYKVVMPTNLYGPNDSFDLSSSHVLPALIRKFHEAKINGSSNVVVWGSGTPRREFLYIDDLAEACMLILNDSNGYNFVNVGCGEDITINNLSLIVKDVVGFDGDIIFDKSKPDGTPRKLLDISILKSLGWEPKVGLRDGIKRTYRWFLEELWPRVKTT